MINEYEVYLISPETDKWKEFARTDNKRDAVITFRKTYTHVCVVDAKKIVEYYMEHWKSIGESYSYLKRGILWNTPI